MKQLGAAADKAARDARHRQWRWCRRPNGFCDKPLWRVVAAELNLPLPHIVAFVNRLEEHANAADPRGYVGDFNAAEFGAALGMPAADAGRIYAALEHPDIGWLHQDHVLTFYDRNPDKEDGSAAERQRRSRSFKAALRALAQQAADRRITMAERRECERAIFALQQQARGGTIDESELHRRLFEVLHPEKSTGHGGHAVTDRDSVTVTPRADRSHQARPVENVGEGSSAAPAGASEDGACGKSSDPQAEAAVWLRSTGAKIITERMDIQPTLAATKVERWWRQGLDGDAVALRDIIERVDRAGYVDVRFHTEVADAIERLPRTGQRVLPLPVPLKGGGRG